LSVAFLYFLLVLPSNPEDFAEGLAVIAETEEELIKRFSDWKDNMESKGMRVNMNKPRL